MVRIHTTYYLLRVFSFFSHFDSHLLYDLGQIIKFIYTLIASFNEDNTILLEKYFDNLLSELKIHIHKFN